ncbi:MAG: N-acetyltransferase family protein [Chitinophagaceae bacterium]|nr:MAG: N-acetyltransferase family protein [Chitinophagaceae bacterium]
MIEPLLPEHWEAVKRIYENGIATGNATFQTAAPAIWEEWDKGHLEHSRFVAKEGNKVYGWVALSPTSARECYKGVCELSVYVDNDYRSKGVGNFLMKAVIESSEATGVWCLYSSTFPENEASISLQKKFGFREIGYREKIAQQNGIWRDTVLLERRSKVVGM